MNLESDQHRFNHIFTVNGIRKKIVQFYPNHKLLLEHVDNHPRWLETYAGKVFDFPDLESFYISDFCLLIERGIVEMEQTL